MERRNKVDIDSTEYRKHLWDVEYSTRKALPSSNTFHPSSSLRRFIENHPEVGKDYALDLGCGNGRNSMYLIDNGFQKVLGIDISTEGIEIAMKAQLEKPEYKKIKYIADDVSTALENTTENFDLILDMTVLHSLTKESREKTVEHIKRLLKKDGYYLIFTLMANSPAVIDLMSKNPGPEENSYRFNFDDDVITEKAFTKEELCEMFKPFKLVEYEEYQTVTRAYKGEYPRIYTTALFQNS